MDENQIESLQKSYYEALESKDAEKIQAASDAIEAVLNQQVVPEVVQEVVQDTSSEETTQATQGGEALAEPTAKEGEPAPTSATDDWLGSLDPNIRKNVEQLLKQNQQLVHQRKSDEGRVAAFQRRYEEAQKKAVQNEELVKKLQGQTTAQPQGNPAANQQTKLLTVDDDPELKAIAETDEQLARVILKREAALRSELEQMRNDLVGLKTEFNPLKTYQEEAHTRQELQRLEQFVPNAVQIFNYRDPDTGVNYWEDWVKRQPKAIQAAAESYNAEEVAQALRLHIMDMQAYFGFNQQAPAQESKPAPVVDQQKIEAVQQERERKLSAQPVGSASVKPPQNAQPSFEQIMSNPDLLAKYQQKIYEEELKKRNFR